MAIPGCGGTRGRVESKEFIGAVDELEPEVRRSPKVDIIKWGRGTEYSRSWR